MAYRGVVLSGWNSSIFDGKWRKLSADVGLLRRADGVKFNVFVFKQYNINKRVSNVLN